MTGPHEERLANYGQGNAAAGLGFTAMSSLIVNAYLCNGYGAQIYSSYYKQLLILAAVMYVEDTDLVHWSSVPSCTPTELIEAAQTVTSAWGGCYCNRCCNETGEMLRPISFYTVMIMGGQN